MSRIPMCKYWLQRLGIATVSVIVSGANCSLAQIAPDGTLPNNSNVRLEENTRIIEGGTTSGTNLFHSFSEFSVPTGGTAFFNNATNIQNILTRVTGSSISNIDGILRANGTANLFLLNPNGILFGSNARLEIGGSFVSSTANSIKFGDRFEFSATNPQTTPLLTISVPIGLQYGVNPGRIQVQGDGGLIADRQNSIVDTKSQLQVQPNQTLALVGGDISLEGATLKAVGGRIELGSVTGNALVSLISTNPGWVLDYQGITNFQNIRLSDGANIAVNGDGKGSIAINANNIDVRGSNIRAGVDAGFQFLGTQSGVLALNARGIVSVNNGIIANEVKGIGNGGNINIKGRSLFLSNGAVLSTNSFAEGNAGNIAINTDNIVSLDDANSTGESAISANLLGTGNGGKITINAQKVVLSNGATVVAHTEGRGNAGSIQMTATEDISIKGVGTGVGSQVFPSAVGNGGAITINAPKVSLSNGATIVAHTTGRGNAGNIEMTATDNISMSGIGTGVGSQTFAGGVGNGGKITVNTPQLSLSDGVEIVAHTHTLGNAGSITINANKILLDGVASNGNSSGIGSAAFRLSRGNGGEIIINTDSLSVTNGASLYASSFGEKDAGNVTINATGAVSFDGIGAYGRYSNAFSSVGAGSTGKGGEIKITANSLSVKNGAIIGANTNGQGDGGNININVSTLEVQCGGQILTTSGDRGNAGEISVNATDSITISGSDPTFPERIARFGRPTMRGEDPASGILANTNVNSTGSGGSINVTTKRLSINEGALISATSQGSGRAGNINANVRSILLDNKATLNANTQSINNDLNKPQATIDIRSQILILRRGSNITTNARGNNVIGGNIIITSPFLIALPGENSDISANSLNAEGGNVTINATGIYGIQPRLFPTSFSDITATGASSDLSGNVQINTLDIDPSSTLVELPTNLVDRTRLIAQGCPANAGNSFIITGRGGLPPLPSDPLRSNRLATIPWVTRDEQESKGDGEKIPLASDRTQNTELTNETVEAVGWAIDKSGEIWLTASAPTSTFAKPHSSLSTPENCLRN
ncbi:filamentous hemagglutinin N-terminal domain-containing protein [Scytonema sp. NUACC26]|uniref:two-partner secretion domain-containing protein n=1 Tax=Scytonema sp. NUACC26 TaxID=3140176 RepID=UPI0034DC169F